MIYTWNELIKKEGSRSSLESLIANGKYKRISHGIYSDSGDDTDLEMIFARYPRSVLTLQSAFEYYGLSTYIPEKYYIATPRNSCVIDDNRVCQSYMSNDIINVGRVVDNTKYGRIYIYDLERLLIELFRYKNKLPRDYFLEIINSYRPLFENNKISFFTLEEYSRYFKNGLKIIRNIQEVFA